MARGLKRRASSSGDAADTKRKCAGVAKAVKSSQELSESCRSMLSGMATFALDTYEADRHPWQVAVMGMLKKTLEGVDADIGRTTASAHELVASADFEKKKRRDAVTHAEASLQEKVEAVASKKASADESSTALQAAKAAVADALKKQTKGDEELKLIEGKKERLESFFRNAFGPLKEGSLHGAELNSALRIVSSVSNQFDLEKPMVKAALECLKQTPTERSAFLVTSVSQMEENIKSLIATIGEEVAKGQPGKEERAAAVATAKSTQADAEAAASKAATDLHEAQNEKKQADAALKGARHAVANYLPDMKKIMDAYDSKKSAGEQFKQGVLADFAVLQTLSAPPPPEEEPAAEEAETAAAVSPRTYAAGVTSPGAASMVSE